MIVSVPVSIGELLDKVTILLIKSQFAQTPSQQSNIDKELKLLQNIVDDLGIGGHPLFDSMFQALLNINTALWHIEDKIRKPEDLSQEEFITLAKSVHTTNDERSSLKRQINTTFQSDIIEEKIY